MSETEQLRDATEKQKLKERAEAFHEYMQGLIAQCEIAVKGADRAIHVVNVAMLVSLVNMFTTNILWLISFTLWFFALEYMHTKQTRAVACVQELRGAINVLKLLGYIDDQDTDNKARNFEYRMKRSPMDALRSLFKKHATT